MSRFDEVIERHGTDSIKWDGLEELYGDASLIPMWVADTDFKTPEAVISVLVNRAEHGIFGYGTDGTVYKQSIVDWHKKRHNIVYAAEHIYYSVSVLTSLSLILSSLTKAGSTVLIANPTYGPFRKVTEATGRICLASELLDDDGYYTFDFADIETKIIEQNVEAFILCNPHNPVGRVWTESELETLVIICKKHNVLLIADEIHSDLIMPGFRYTPCMKLANDLNYQDKTIILNSPTKSFNLAGIQVSYYITTNALYREKIEATRNRVGIPGLLNTFALPALQAAYLEGSEYIEELTAYIYTNYQYVLETIQTKFPQVKVTALEATYLIWIDLTAFNVEEAELKKVLVASGIAIQAKSDFFETKRMHIRVNIACPKATLIKGVDCLIKAFETLEK